MLQWFLNFGKVIISFQTKTGGESLRFSVIKLKLLIIVMFLKLMFQVLALRLKLPLKTSALNTRYGLRDENQYIWTINKACSVKMVQWILAKFCFECLWTNS